MAEADWRKRLARLLYDGDLEGAANLLEGGLRNSPKNIPMKIELGKVQFMHGDIDGARTTFEAVLMSRPDNAEALKGKGDVLEVFGDY